MVYYKNLKSNTIKDLLGRYGIHINSVTYDTDIPHSFWGSPEAGRLREQLYIREDTPIHSILHEASHYVCMHAAHRALTQIDAKGSVVEENATCYLQILLAEQITGYSRSQIMKDMDTWGYSFRLGSAHTWFEQDAEDARLWLLKHQIIDHNRKITWNLRSE